MIQNNNFSVLPWYSDIPEGYSVKQQNHNLSYAYGNIYPLFTPARYLPPFQIMRNTLANRPITRFEIFDKTGKSMYGNIVTELMNAGTQIVRFASLGYDIIVYPGYLPMNINIPDGIYYAQIADGTNRWTSEMFTVVQDVSGYLKIEWYDAENMVFDAGQIVYQNPTFKNRLYLCTELGKPEYQFEEEGEKRDGYFFPEKQISEKTYRAICLAPEYLCDVMRFIRMADYVFVTDKYGRTYDCDTFLITPKWQTQGDLASVEIEFKTATVVKKIGRGFMPTQQTGDFNNDYNNDFLTQ